MELVPQTSLVVDIVQRRGLVGVADEGLVVVVQREAPVVAEAVDCDLVAYVDCQHHH